MRIGELSDRLGVNPKTVRYYESIGLLPEPERTPSGYRIYTEADIDRVAFIKTAQRLGITLDEIREILALRDRGERPCGYVRDVLRREVAAVGNRLVELRQLREHLIELDRLADTLSEADDGFTCQLIDHVRARAEAAADADGMQARNVARPHGEFGRRRGSGESPGRPRTSSGRRSADRRTDDDDD